MNSDAYCKAHRVALHNDLLLPIHKIYIKHIQNMIPLVATVARVIQLSRVIENFLYSREKIHIKVETPNHVAASPSSERIEWPKRIPFH